MKLCDTFPGSNRSERARPHIPYQREEESGLLGGAAVAEDAGREDEPSEGEETSRQLLEGLRLRQLLNRGGNLVRNLERQLSEIRYMPQGHANWQNVDFIRMVRNMNVISLALRTAFYTYSRYVVMVNGNVSS